MSHLVTGDDVASGIERLKAGWFWNVGGRWLADIPLSYLLFKVRKYKRVDKSEMVSLISLGGFLLPEVSIFLRTQESWDTV